MLELYMYYYFRLKVSKHFVVLCTTEHSSTVSLHAEGGIGLVLSTEN